MADKSEPRFNNVLLVDDNEIDNFINEKVISSVGFAKSIDVKNSADAALDFIRSCASDTARLPDLIFLDLNMPVKDGFAFLDDYDKLEDALKANTKIVVLSSSISPEDISRASTNPYVLKYINKPLSEKYLEAI